MRPQQRFVARPVGGRFRVYDSTRASFPYQTHELGSVRQDTTESVAVAEARRLNALAPGKTEPRSQRTDLLEDEDLHEDSTARAAEASGFAPARDKREAVGRISAWTGGPESTLGPGSTEKRSVLVWAASFAGAAGPDTTLSKPDLARVTVEHLGELWDEDCSSSGSTVTLTGLNRVLRSLELRTVRESSTTANRTPAQEARLILAEAVRATPHYFDGRSAVTEMREAESSGWAQSEWPGFYFELVALGPCTTALAGGPVTTSTRSVFDLGGAHVWDLKVHDEAKQWAPLNDKIATDEIVAGRGGLGLVVLSGQPHFDEAFKAWFDEEKVRYGRPPRPRSRPARFHRRVKSAFTPHRLDVIYLPADTWPLAVGNGVIRHWSQGRQPSGRPRNPKYEVDVRRAAELCGVASATF